MKLSAAFPGLLIALTSWLPAASQEPATPIAAAYNVEIIVFRATTALGSAENWAAEAATRKFSNDSSAGESPSGDAREVGRFLSALPESQFQLTDIEKKLRASAGYAPLAHVAWSQTASAWGTARDSPYSVLASMCRECPARSCSSVDNFCISA